MRLMLTAGNGSTHKKVRPTVFGPLTGNYKINCPGCKKTYKTKPDCLDGMIECPGCNYLVEYKFF